MFWLLVQEPTNLSVWSATPIEELHVALIAAEVAFKSIVEHAGENRSCVQVIEQGVVKAKWGPEDPGGIFNTGNDQPFTRCVHGAHPDRCEACATGME